MLRIMSHPIQILSKLIGGSMNFTREESKIGMWGDKPLYCKMLSGDTLTNNNIISDENNGNYEAIIANFGYGIYNSTDPMYKIPVTASLGGNFFYIGLTTDGKLISKNSLVGKHEIVILYTKVID